MMAKYKLYVRDSNFNKIAEIDDYVSLEMIPRFNAVGAWTLVLPTNCEAAKAIITPKAGIVVVRDGQTVFSGPAIQRKRNWSTSADQLTISGYDDMIVLQRNLAYPVPSGPPYTAQSYDVRTGPAETVMKGYVNDNIGANTRMERNANITMEPDKGLGLTVTGSARFGPLLDLLSSLALAGGDIGFRVLQIGTGLQFQVYQPIDNTKTAIFSPLLGNLLDFEYTDQDPDANYIFAGGAGDGTARIVVEQGDSNSISTYGRIEEFLDNSSTSDTNQLYQAITTELAQKANKTSLTITPNDTDGLTFGRDYNLGDQVSVVITQPNEIVEEEEINIFVSFYQAESFVNERSRVIQEKLDVIQDVVREIKFTITKDGEVITPSIGTPDSISSRIPGIFTKMKKIDRRLSNIERR